MIKSCARVFEGVGRRGGRLRRWFVRVLARAPAPSAPSPNHPKKARAKEARRAAEAEEARRASEAEGSKKSSRVGLTSGGRADLLLMCALAEPYWMNNKLLPFKTKRKSWQEEPDNYVSKLCVLGRADLLLLGARRRLPEEGRRPGAEPAVLGLLARYYTML